jgi:hypothetical protein
MPELFRSAAMRFFFYSNEGNPREPIHIHVEDGDASAKTWLEPAIGIAESDGFNRKHPFVIIGLLVDKHTRIRKASHGHFGN